MCLALIFYEICTLKWNVRKACILFEVNSWNFFGDKRKTRATFKVIGTVLFYAGCP